MKYLLKIIVIAFIIMWSINASGAIQKAIDIESKHQAESSHDTQSGTEQQKESAKKPLPSFPTFTTQNPAAESDNKADKTKDEGTEFWSPFFGYKFKITDTLLIVFTCLLSFATVGLWFATRKLVTNTDKMNRDTEHAYLIGGGPEVKKDGSNSSIITIHNAGRNTGFLTKLQWKICDEKNFLPKVKVSKILNENLIEGIVSDVIEEDNVWPASEKFGLEHFIITNHGDHIGRILFGQVDFKDIFGDSHYSTFKLRLHKGGSRTLPGSYSEDWE